MPELKPNGKRARWNHNLSSTRAGCDRPRTGTGHSVGADRHFNRARYDAEAVVAGFSQRLRHAVDIETVHGELVVAVSGAVQPGHASLWIKPPA